ncbi:sulfur carrier protein ThiS [Natranaerofaba carboxydovora]|uniref:sulfur carrier protein ThiS n=1 Tax=Natranaerofaba carboxydovora TaxID=2742683 RepID=UPI001F1325A1|nr:sulfur carrier protein ThiS [Natranaerofaba carboxydovora]UMZ73175.1 Sulfur carrier protein ThiS [Natranaerofaba carboxydovora]
MELKINGEKRNVNDGLTIKGLLDELGVKSEGKIIVLNQEVVPEEQWEDKELKENEEIEILNMVGGG